MPEDEHKNQIYSPNIYVNYLTKPLADDSCSMSRSSSSSHHGSRIASDNNNNNIEKPIIKFMANYNTSVQLLFNQAIKCLFKNNKEVEFGQVLREKTG